MSSQGIVWSYIKQPVNPIASRRFRWCEREWGIPSRRETQTREDMYYSRQVAARSAQQPCSPWNERMAAHSTATFFCKAWYIDAYRRTLYKTHAHAMPLRFYGEVEDVACHRKELFDANHLILSTKAALSSFWSNHNFFGHNMLLRTGLQSQSDESSDNFSLLPLLFWIAYTRLIQNFVPISYFYFNIK